MFIFQICVTPFHTENELKFNFLRFWKSREFNFSSNSTTREVSRNQNLGSQYFERQSTRLANTTRTKFSKPTKLLTITLILGTVDGVQAKYMTIGNISETAAISYQVVFMLVTVFAAYFCLFDEKWSPARNLSNLLLAIPVATLADNISIDVQALKPYFLFIPSNGYLWRIDVFGHTFLSPVAYWVNQQWLMSGLINGYATAIGIFAGYLTLQYFWVRTEVASRFPSWKPVLDFGRLRRQSPKD